MVQEKYKEVGMIISIGKHGKILVQTLMIKLAGKDGSVLNSHASLMINNAGKILSKNFLAL